MYQFFNHPNTTEAENKERIIKIIQTIPLSCRKGKKGHRAVYLPRI